MTAALPSVPFIWVEEREEWLRWRWSLESALAIVGGDWKKEIEESDGGGREGTDRQTDMVTERQIESRTVTE